MKKYVMIGTAGHVDHGKTCLVKALTGTDTDRLEEEKRRGITIDLGFAFLPLPQGGMAGIVDVPGHEKFIKNMLAGAGGIRLALLVVAADEGIMPQTVEHLEILSLLGAAGGIVAVTKTDTVEHKRCLEVRKEIEKLTEGTFLERAQVIFTSVKDGTGICELKEEIFRLAEETESSDTGLPFRLPIDRIFTLKGFGTIVTGTLIEGKISVGEEGMLYPTGEKVKIRMLQVNGQDVEQAFAGQRVAANLPGVAKGQLSRGEILAESESMEKTAFAAVTLKLIKSTSKSVKTGSRVHLYHGSEELVCRVRLFDKKVLFPGEECRALFRMEKDTAMKPGDRFIIRSYSPVETVGGGSVVEVNPKRQRTEKQEKNKEVQKHDAGNPLYAILDTLYCSSGFQPPLTQEVKALYGKESDFSRIFLQMVQKKDIIHLDEKRCIHHSSWEKAVETAEQLYREKGEIPTGEFRDQLCISRKTAITILEAFDKARITGWDGKKRTFRLLRGK